MISTTALTGPARKQASGLINITSLSPFAPLFLIHYGHGEVPCDNETRLIPPSPCRFYLLNYNFLRNLPTSCAYNPSNFPSFPSFQLQSDPSLPAHCFLRDKSITGYSKPFVLNVHSDSQEGNSVPAESANFGFCLNFVQQPCTSSSG